MKLIVAALTLVVATPTALAPVTFAKSSGWHTGTEQARVCPGVPSSRCVEAWSWSGTVSWKDCRNCTPHKTLRSLPRDGIVLAVSRVRERPVLARRELRWPPHIRAVEVTAGMEGIPRRYGVYQLFARLPNSDTIVVWAYFGRSRPSTLQVAAANTELRRASLP